MEYSLSMGLRTQPVLGAADSEWGPAVGVDVAPVAAWMRSESRASCSEVLTTSRFCSDGDGCPVGGPPYVMLLTASRPLAAAAAAYTSAPITTSQNILPLRRLESGTVCHLN